MLLTSLYTSMSSLFNVTGVLAASLVAFSMLGTALLSRLKYGSAIDESSNFQSSTSALLFAFRLLTLDDWNVLMYDSMLRFPECTPGTDDWSKGGAPHSMLVDGHGDCGVGPAGVLLWVSGVVILSYTFL